MWSSCFKQGSSLESHLERWTKKKKDNTWAFVFFKKFQDNSNVIAQLLSCVWFFAIPWTEACQASLSFTIFPSLLRLMSVESMMPSNHLIFCCSLLLLPSIFPDITIFSSESTLCIRRAKYHSFSFSISLSNDYSGLISFRIDWFDLPAVQGTLKSLLQHHSSKASILQCSVFFMVQLSLPYTTIGKPVALTAWPLSAKRCLCFWICCSFCLSFCVMFR